MGIKGLKPALKDTIEVTHIHALKGKLVGVDASCWLHRSAFTCARDLCLHGPLRNTAWLDFCQRMVAMMRRHEVEPFIVFDGAKAPCKANEEARREERRKESLTRARSLDNSGNQTAALEHYKQAINVPFEMCERFMRTLREMDVHFIVAPLEADAQLAYMEATEKIAAVVTEDTDLIALGCDIVLFNLDRNGQCERYDRRRAMGESSLGLQSFNQHSFLCSCILAGCDYLPNIPNIGIKTAVRQMRTCKNAERAINLISMESSTRIPEGYRQGFEVALLALRYAWVFNPTEGQVRMRTEDGGDEVDSQKLIGAIGPKPESEVARQIAWGQRNPQTGEILRPQTTQPGTSRGHHTVTPKANAGRDREANSQRKAQPRGAEINQRRLPEFASPLETDRANRKGEEAEERSGRLGEGLRKSPVKGRDWEAEAVRKRKGRMEESRGKENAGEEESPKSCSRKKAVPSRFFEGRQRGGWQENSKDEPKSATHSNERKVPSIDSFRFSGWSSYTENVSGILDDIDTV